MSIEKYIPLHILEKITNEFSAHSRIGTGGYGDVYKAVYNGREVAVKLLHVDTVQGIDDQQYINEVGNLLRLNHPNIVQLLGYSYETRSPLVVHNGKRRLSQHIYRVLCFEYLQGGSLDVRLREKSLAPDWSTRYNIIKGICEGLNFLHGCKPAILHLDLKPANILLDNGMVPKVADFGLSRVISQSHTQVTKQIRGTHAYMPPEFINGGNISHKNDVFSLGLLMIEIMTGSSGYSSYIGMDKVAQQKVHNDWKNRIKATSEYPSEELHQVQTCIDIAMRCVEPDRNNRPTIAEVLDFLNMTETHIPKRQMSTLPCPTNGRKSTESNMLEMMIAELDNITKKDEHCNSMPRESFNSNVQQVPDRETTSDVEEALIIGRAEEKQKILSILSESITEETVILPIFGIGGIGKTTLAQLVFNDPKFQDYSQVWVHVSETLNLNKIGNSVISQLTDEISQIANMQMLHNRLRKLFTGKSILIVLDDLWEENPDKLNDLMTMLKLGTRRKVIVIVTTRDEAIAKIICGPAITPYKLEILTDDMCWTIIKQKAAFKDRVDKKQLEHIGMEIAIKCGGVALAAHSLGYMLRGMTSDQWESVRDNCIWNLSARKDPSSRIHKVLASLLLSYSHMPNWLKLCFSYCAVFPKGRIIVKYDLIHQWIALGFTEQSDMFNSMQLCEKYVTQLLGMSFLQYSKTQPSSDRRQDKDATLFTMHDLVHDLAKEILAHQINTGGNSCRYALLTDCTKSLQLPFPANIRALHFRDCGKQELCGGAFSPAKCLRVLDLSECSIPKLPDCIGQLKQLRFLCAPWIHDKMIPNCITELSELNYLNLRGSHNISALPESIGDMKALMHLDLSSCSGIREFPKSFTELNQLVHLDLSDSYMPLPEVIGNLINLRYLNLMGGRFWDVPEYQLGSLLHSISTLSNLEHLVLSYNRNLSTIPESISNLRKLHTLDLSGCHYLEKLPDSMYQMVSLKVLIMDKEVTLDESVRSRLNFALLPHFVVHASSDKCSSNISLLRHTYPKKLTIDRLENVMSTEEAQSVKLIGKREIKVLRFEWTSAAERFVDDKDVLEKLVPPSSVERLTIVAYRSVSLPGWFMDITQYLPNLSMLNLWNFPKCSKLPSLGQLPNLKALGLHSMEGLEEWNTTHYSVMFPKLLSLDIKDCDTMLSSWGESSSHSGTSSSSPFIQLNVAESKVPMHHWRLLHHLPAFRKLIITDCSDLTTSPQIIHSLSSLRELDLESLSQVELPRWLVELTSLQELTLSGCASMTLPAWLGELTSLENLEIEHCKGIRSLPDSIQQLTKLECLRIEGCPTLVKWCKSKQNNMKLDHIEEVEFVPSDEEDEADGSSSCGDEEDEADGSSSCGYEADEADGSSSCGYEADEADGSSSCGDKEDEADGSAYMGMQGEQRAPRLINFLPEPEHCTIRVYQRRSRRRSDSKDGWGDNRQTRYCKRI